MFSDSVQPEYLFRLARSGDDQDRYQLAQSVISFMQYELQPGEQSIAQEILLQLLKEASNELRMSLAEQLATEKNCPLGLLDYLIYENPIEVSAPVLQYSPVLDDTYLIDVAKHFKRTEYWQILARRSHVSENLSRFLVGTDDLDVFRLLLKNRGAHLCTTSMNWLADVAANVAEIQKPLLTRPEVTPELAAKLYWCVSAELRSQITARFDMSQKQIDVLLDQAVKQRIAEKQEVAEISDGMVELATHLKEQNRITSHQLLEALKKDDLPFFACLWAALLNLSAGFVSEKLEEDFAVNMAIMCKAANITRRDYNVFYLLWKRKKKYLAPETLELAAALEYFNDLQPVNAMAILRKWQDEGALNHTVH